MREGRELPPPMEDQEEDALNAELRAARIDWDWVAVVEEADAVADRLIRSSGERIRTSFAHRIASLPERSATVCSTR